MPGWIRKNGAYRQIGVPTHYELASATLLTGGAGYDTTMELVILPVGTGDQEAVISIDEVNDSGAITSSHISARGKFSAETDITNATLVVRESGEVIEFQGTDATFTLLAEDYTGLDSAVFIRKNGAWRPCSAGYMRRGNAWRQIYLPAQAQENPPEPVSDIAVKYIAVAPNGKVHTSDDGYTYVETSTIESSSTGRILFYADDGYYYTAVKNGATSDAKRTKDGVVWESLNVPNNIGMVVFAKGGDGNYVFLNKNDNKVYYTDDPVGGVWQSFFIATSGLDWNSLFWADLGSGNQYWYISADTSTTAYRFLIGGTISSLTLTNKQNYGKLTKCNSLIRYPYYTSEVVSMSSGTRASSIRFVTLYTYTNAVSWDGVVFTNTEPSSDYSQASGVTYNDMVYNNNVYCSNRASSGGVVSYVAGDWVASALSYKGELLVALTGNFCSFYGGTIASARVSRSSDGQNWTTAQPTLPAEITTGNLDYFSVKTGQRVYWTNYTVGSSSTSYDYIIGTTDGATFSLVSGLDPETMYQTGRLPFSATENNQGYALASKMG